MLKGFCALFDAVLRYLLLLWSGFWQLQVKVLRTDQLEEMTR